MKRKVQSLIAAICLVIAFFLLEQFGIIDLSQADVFDSTTVSTYNNIEETQKEYSFRNNDLLEEHYEKHGKEMGFASEEEYEKAAGAVVNNPLSLHKLEAEDNDDIYYLEKTNEYVVVSTDGYIRTYFCPDSGIKYYNKQ